MHNWVVKIAIIITGLFPSTWVFPQPQNAIVKSSEVFIINESKIDNLKDSDLAFLSKALEKKQIVFLGEARHGDGQTIHAKNRIIKFLVEQAGFEVVIFENNIYEIHKMRELLAHKNLDYVKILNEVFRWGFEFSLEDSRLKEWMIKNKANCKYEGIEPLYNSRIADLLVDDLRSAGIKNDLAKDYVRLLKTINREAFSHKINPGDLNFDFEKYLQLSQQIEKSVRINSKNSVTRDYLLQIIKNNLNLANLFSGKSNYSEKEFFDFIWREKPMFENLMFHLKSYSNKKIIVSTSTYHITRSILESKTMVDHLPDSIIQKSYFLPFISYQGLTGRYYEGSDLKIDTVKCSKGYLEEELHRISGKDAFVDFSNLNADQINHIDSLQSATSPTFGTHANWTKIFNGLFFIDTMTPNYHTGLSMEHDDYIKALVKLKK